VAAKAAALHAALTAVRERWGLHSIVPLDTYRAARVAPGAPPSAPPPWWPDPQAAPVPQVLELVGPVSSGKLTLALLWLAAVPSDGPVAVVDVAGRFYPPAAAACGLDARRLAVVRPPRRRDIFHVVAELTRSDGFDAVLTAVDATTHVSLAEAGQLRAFASAAQTSVLLLRDAPPPPLPHLPNTERAGMRVSGPLSPGSDAPPVDGRHGRGEGSHPTLPLSDARLRIEAHAWLWEHGELAGQRLRVRTERSRQGLAGQTYALTFRLSRRWSHGARPDHLYLDSTLRADRGHARAAAGR